MMDVSNLKIWLRELCQEVGGDWLLVGGSLGVLSLGITRSTHDIDLLDLAPEVDRVRRKTELLTAAKRFGLTPEQLNSAADFFVQRCDGWQGNLVLLEDFGGSRVFRPNLTLFMALKLNRGTEIDVEDARSAWSVYPQSEFNPELFARWSNKRAQGLYQRNFS